MNTLLVVGWCRTRQYRDSDSDRGRRVLVSAATGRPCSTCSGPWSCSSSSHHPWPWPWPVPLPFVGSSAQSRVAPRADSPLAGTACSLASESAQAPLQMADGLPAARPASASASRWHPFSATAPLTNGAGASHRRLGRWIRGMRSAAVPPHCPACRARSTAAKDAPQRLSLRNRRHRRASRLAAAARLGDTGHCLALHLVPGAAAPGLARDHVRPRRSRSLARRHRARACPCPPRRSLPGVARACCRACLVVEPALLVRAPASSRIGRARLRRDRPLGLPAESSNLRRAPARAFVEVPVRRPCARAGNQGREHHFI